MGLLEAAHSCNGDGQILLHLSLFVIITKVQRKDCYT